MSDGNGWETGDKYNGFITKELNSFRKEAWKKQIGKHLTEEKMKILDVGTGPGFFACILSEMGHDVTGIDSICGNASHMAEKVKKEGIGPKLVKTDVN